MHTSRGSTAGDRATAKDIDTLLVELLCFRGGVADTSTLIYLERLGLLARVSRCFSLVIIPQVAAEYGHTPAGTISLTTAPAGPADMVVCQAAHGLGLPVLSEDRHVLRAARAGQLSYYNTLMIVLACCAQGELALAAWAGIRRDLLAFARYGPSVVARGDAVFAALDPSSVRG